MVEGFEIVSIADEYMAVPVGNRAESFQGVVILNEVAAFLLENMKQSISKESLVDILISQYDVESKKASEDVEELLIRLIEMGLVSVN